MKKNKEPLVSVGMPVYNGERYIRQALDSLLAQDYPNIEFIISDNASTDHTAKICLEYAANNPRITFVQNNRNIGAEANFERVIELAAGEYFMWAAHDDLWDNAYVSECIAKLQERPDTVLCCSSLRFIDKDGAIINQEYDGYDNPDLTNPAASDRVKTLISRKGWYAIYGLIKSSVLKEALRKVRKTRNKYGYDVILLLQLCLIGPFCKVPNILFYYRQKGRSEKDRYNEVVLSPAGGNANIFLPYTSLACNIINTVLNSHLSNSAKEQIISNLLTLFASNQIWDYRFKQYSQVNSSAHIGKAPEYKQFIDTLPFEPRKLLPFVDHGPQKQCATGLRCALIEFNAYHDEVIPTFIYLLNELGIAVDVFMSRTAINKGIFECTKNLNFSLCEIENTSFLFYEKAFQFCDYDFVIINSLEPKRWLQITDSINIPIIGVIHNVSLLTKDSDYEKFFLKENRVPIALAKHIPNSCSHLMKNINWISPVFLNDTLVAQSTQKTEKVSFVVSGNLEPRRNYNSLLDAVERLVSDGFTNFRIKLVGYNEWPWGKAFKQKVREKGLSAFFTYSKGKVDYKTYFSMVMEGDFILPLLDQTDSKYLPYFVDKCTASMHVAIGLGIVPILHKRLSELYGIQCGIMYKDGELFHALKIAAKWDSESLNECRSKLYKKRLSLLQESKNNFRKILKDLNVNVPCSDKNIECNRPMSMVIDLVKDDKKLLETIVLNERGEELFNKGDIAGALTAFKKAIEIDPSFATAYNNLGVLYWQDRETQKAIEHFNKAFEINPNDKNTIFNFGTALISLEKFKEAKNLFVIYLNTNSKDKEISQLLHKVEHEIALREKRKKSPRTDADAFPKFSFIIIVLNGMPFIEYAIKAIYDFAHEIIIVEGAVEKCLFAANLDGSSKDGTVEFIKSFSDPQKKLKLIQGRWPEKVHMQNKALEFVTGDYVWLVDSDEVYKQQDLVKIKELVQSDPSITQINFIPDNFWKGFDYIFVSPKFFEKAAHYRRVFKFVTGAYFSSHRPPTMIWPESNISTEQMNLIDGHRTREMGIIPCHYSYVLNDQVKQKIELYNRYGWGKSWGIDLDEWYKECFLEWTPKNRDVIEKKYPVWTGDRNSYTERFIGAHPEGIENYIKEFRRRSRKKVNGNKPKRIKIAADYDSGGMKIDTEGEFSSRIQSFFKEKQPKKIIETGTYLGNGTTSIIAASLQQFGIEDSKFYTIEVNPKYYHTALNNLRNNGLLKYVSPLNGLSVPRKILPTLKEINEQCVKNIEFDDIFVDHQENERALLYYQETNFENLKDDLLGECLKKFDYRPDFVLLDSGGHMGNIEFNYLISQLRGECYIALDDIYHIKHHKSFLQIQRDPRFELIASSKEKFGFCIAKFAPEQKNDSRQIKNILWVRTDSIGDNVLAASMLPYIRKKYENAKITVVCQKHITELYEACPFVDNIITFDRYRALQDEEYRSSIVQRLRALHADIALNSIYSREPLTDVFAIESGAKERIAFNGDLCNIPAEARARHNQFYSRLLPSGEGNKPELERHRDFLKGLGIDASSLQSIIWTTSEDEKFADDFFTSNNLQPEKTIALFAGAQREVRIYHQYGTALSQICNDNDFAVIALGSEIEHVINQESCDAIGVRTINLCGKTTLRQTAALLKRCRLAVGAETGTAHIACAVGTPNVILLGGGHFGRFIPYSPSTSIVCLPLECYGCNWHCKYQRVHCVKDILPGVITEAVRQTLEKSSEKPRVFVQGSSLWNQEAGQPKWKTFDAFLDISSVEIIPVGEILPVARAILLNSNGEDLFAKGDVESALNAFTETIEINPNFATAHNNLGVLYWQTGEVQKAVDHFTRALEIDPNDRDTILNCGELFKSLEKVEDAKNIYSSYLQKNPNDKEIARALADLQVRRVIEVKDEDEKYFVSAIVSTYNSERFIRGCLEDLEAQTIADRLEIIVINSGSEQNEEAIVKEFQEKYSNIKYIRTDQRETVYAAWNRGVKASSGKYITNANADDRRRADACERMVEVLEGRPDIALVYANVIITENENETFSKCTPAGSYRWLDWNRCHLLEKGCFMGPQPMWRRNLHEEYGYFDDTLVTSGDYEFWLRVSQTNNFLHINDMLGLYLKSPDSIEHSNRKRQATENERILSMYRKAAAEGSIIRRFYSDDKIDLIRVHNRKGEELFQAGNIEGAKDIFEQILLRDPRLVEPLNNLGVIAFQQGETDQAISYFTRVLETDENYFEAIENLGKCAEVQKDYLKAAEWFERALKLKPDEIGLLNSLGNCFIQAENLSKAREVYEKSFGLDEGQENIKAILRELEGLKEAKNEAQPIHRLHRF